MGTTRASLRSCIVCHRTTAKSDLLRLVRSNSGDLQLDQGGRMPGRGAYFCPRLSCIQQAQNDRRVSRTLKLKVDEETWQQLASDLAACVSVAHKPED